MVARIPREIIEDRDITGGLPRVAELFEARRPRTSRSSPEIDGTCRIRPSDYKAKRRIVVVPVEGGGEPVEYLMPKGKHWRSEGDVVRRAICIDGRQPGPA